jgi:hypothetical protein
MRFEKEPVQVFGFLTILLCAYGFGALLPSVRTPLPEHSIRLFAGVMLLAVFNFVVHFALGVELRTTAFILLGLAACGLARAAIGFSWRDGWPWLLAHPVAGLGAGVIAVAALQGDVGYFVYLSDDYARWVGIAKQIHALGGLEPARIVQTTPGYNPGWPLLLSLPGAVTGTFDDGQAALIPLVMHLGLLGIAFDLAVSVLQRDAELSKRRAWVLAWMLVLLLLAVEATGQLIARNLLSEPPQVYDMTVVALLCLVTARHRDAAVPLAVYIGTVFAGLFLIKMTAVSLVPALAAFAAIIAWTGDTAGVGRVRRFVDLVLRYLAGAAVMLVLWRTLGPKAEVVHHANPLLLLSPQNLARWFSEQSLDVARVWLGAVWAWISVYKVPVTAASLAGLAWAARSRDGLPVVLLLAVFVISYVGSLMLFQVEIWGYYINSVPRFMRVWLRVVHFMGLLMAALLAVAWLRRHWPAAFALPFANLPMRGLCGAGLVLLAGWQIHVAQVRIDDLGTRAQHTLMPMMRELTAEAKAIRAEMDRTPEREHRIIFLNADGHTDETLLAFYHLLPTALGADRPNFLLIGPQVSWGMATKIAHSDAGEPDLPKEVRRADIVWPFRMNDRYRRLLAGLVLPGGCAANPTGFLILANSQRPGEWRCVAKPPPEGIDPKPGAG